MVNLYNTSLFLLFLLMVNVELVLNLEAQKRARSKHESLLVQCIATSIRTVSKPKMDPQTKETWRSRFQNQLDPQMYPEKTWRSRFQNQIKSCLHFCTFEFLWDSPFNLESWCNAMDISVLWRNCLIFRSLIEDSISIAGEATYKVALV
jgi:hypothetical protein